MISLMLGDCLERMKEIPSGSIDMVLADPPYGTTACKWDSVIDLPLMWEQLKRVIKPNGAIVMTASQPFTTALIASNLQMFRYSWIWVKNQPGGFAQAKNKPMTKHEDIAVFSEGRTGHISQCKRRIPYNPQGLVYIGREVKNSKSHRASAFEARKNAKTSYVQEYTNYPDSILNFDCQRDGHHPTQKPVALMEYLIKTYTNKGETVLDFAMGSGTTGIAALNTGRKFIGIEMDKCYFDVATERIHKAKPNL